MAGSPLTVTLENIERLIDEHRALGYNPRNIDKLLDFVFRYAPRPGDWAKLDVERDFPIIDCTCANEFRWYLQIATQRDLLANSDSALSLTDVGWAYLMGPSTDVIRGRCFVAMSFDEKHDPILVSGIRPALTEAGYDAVCMKVVHTNDDINDRILAEIRKAQIVVADFTGQKGGVYFEAGFALALKKDLYCTCARSELAQLHFDVNHRQFILWDNPADIHRPLVEKIEALSGQGPFRPLSV